MPKDKEIWLSKKRHAQAVSDMCALQQVAEFRKDKKRVAAVRLLMKMQMKKMAKKLKGELINGGGKAA